MLKILRHLLFIFLLCPHLTMDVSLVALEISLEEAQEIGNKIFYNECGSKLEKLVWWNDQENFASLGIGHFIWYPQEVIGIYEETFPEFLIFLKQKQVCLPHWLTSISSCPWKNKTAFLSKEAEVYKKQLQTLLQETIPLQTVFITQRAQNKIISLLSSMPKEKQEKISLVLKALESNAQGKFALIDYLNFKGDGTRETERYQGKGWGLKQVLESMPLEEKNILHAYVETAKTLLKQRVANAPKDYHEERWLKGWLARIDRYETH